MPNQSHTASPAADDTAGLASIFKLMMMGQSHPELRKAEARARVQLASAIRALDAAASVPGRHTLNEQLAVNQAKDDYAQALADLLRGDDGQ